MKHSVEEIQLSNGIRGLLIDVPSASVMNFDIEMRAGHYLVPKKKWETPHIMEHMVFGANKAFPSSRTFCADFEKNGAYNNASTDVISLHYLAECADFEWERIMKMLLLSVSQPLFLESEFKSEYSNVREEMIGRSNNNYRYLFQKMAMSTGYISMTDKERVKLMGNVNIDDIRNHFLRTHSTDNLRFIICGNLARRKGKIIKHLEAIKLPRGQRFAYPKQHLKSLKDVLYVRRTNVKNVYFSLDTFINEEISREQERALSLLDVILGEREDSLLYGQAREEGLIYHVDVSHLTGLDNVNWGVSGQVSVDNAKDMFALIERQISKVCEGDITSQNVNSARDYYIGALQMSVQKISRLSALYARRYFLDEQIRNFNDVADELQGIDKDDIVAVANRLFASRIWALGVLGSSGVAHARSLREIVAPLWDN